MEIRYFFKFKYVKCILLTGLLSLLSGIATSQPQAKYALTLSVPEGWVVCEKGMIQSPYGPVPLTIVKKSRNPKYDFVAYDPKAFQNQKSAFMTLTETFFGTLSEDTEEQFLQKTGVEFEKVVRRSKGNVIERKVVTAYGRRALRIIGHIPSKRIDSTFLTFYFIDRHHIDQVNFSTDADIFNSYAPVFQGSISRTLKGIQPTN